jgi:hypothetical protein
VGIIILFGIEMICSMPEVGYVVSLCRCSKGVHSKFTQRVLMVLARAFGPGNQCMGLFQLIP